MLAGFGLAVDGYKVNQDNSLFSQGRSAVVEVQGNDAAVIGELSAGVRKKLKLPEHTACFELSLGILQQASGGNYQPLSKFPSVSQDVTLRVASTAHYEDVYSTLLNGLKDGEPAHSSSSLTPISIYQSDDNAEHKNMTWRYKISNYDRTLTDNEINSLIDQAVAGFADMGVERV